MALELDHDTKAIRVEFAEILANMYFAGIPVCLLQVMGTMSAHNTDRSSKRSSGGPHLGFRGMKVPPLFTFTAKLSQLSHHYSTAFFVSDIVAAIGISPEGFA